MTNYYYNSRTHSYTTEKNIATEYINNVPFQIDISFCNKTLIATVYNEKYILSMIKEARKESLDLANELTQAFLSIVLDIVRKDTYMIFQYKEITHNLLQNIEDVININIAGKLIVINVKK